MSLLIEVEKIREQHLKNYKMALLELIENNTKTLIQEDILSLLRKPPLDSMDLIKSKLIQFSKKSLTILDIEALNQLIVDYRKMLVASFQNIGDDRILKLSQIVDNFQPKNE